MKGLVLAKVTPGMENPFFGGLGVVHQVRSVYYLFDEYDYFIEVEAESEDELVRVVAKDLRHLPGVERTAGFLLMERGNLAPVVRRREDAPAERTIFNPMRDSDAGPSVP